MDYFQGSREHRPLGGLFICVCFDILPCLCLAAFKGILDGPADRAEYAILSVLFSSFQLFFLSCLPVILLNLFHI